MGYGRELWWQMWAVAMASTSWSGRTLLCWAATAAVAWLEWQLPVCKLVSALLVVSLPMAFDGQVSMNLNKPRMYQHSAES